MEEGIQIKEEEQEKEKEDFIKVDIKVRYAPILRITHEDFQVKQGTPYNVLIKEIGNDYINEMVEYGDYYIRNPGRMKKALWYHIFKLKKEFIIVVPKHEMESRSGSHVISENVYLEEKQPFIAKLKEFVKFPNYAGLYKEDLETLDKMGEKYIALIHYNVLFLFEDVGRFFSNKVEFHLKDKSSDEGIAELRGEIPFKPVQRIMFGEFWVESDKPFRALKGNTFLIIYNPDENEKLKLIFKKEGRDENWEKVEKIIDEIQLPPKRAYYFLDKRRIYR